MSNKIAFNTANLVGRASGNRLELEKWGEYADRVVKATDTAEWRNICRDIVKAGYRAIELWIAHADPRVMTADEARLRRRIADEHGLKIIGLAAACTKENAKVAEWMGIRTFNGGLWGTSLDEVRALVAERNLQFNYENHPEKSVQEILDRIDGGDDNIGVCVDTGWLGTQGLNAAATIEKLAKRVRHVHVKDVKAVGGHETCLLGTGVVNVTEVMAALRRIGYDGWYSWEDEPEDRNPMLSAAENRQWIEKHL